LASQCGLAQNRSEAWSTTESPPGVVKKQATSACVRAAAASAGLPAISVSSPRRHEARRWERVGPASIRAELNHLSAVWQLWSRTPPARFLHGRSHINEIAVYRLLTHHFDSAEAFPVVMRTCVENDE
jgi:hypothetical protein